MKGAVDRLVERLDGLVPQAALVLGSGLGNLAGEVEDAVRIAYADLPGFPATGRVIRMSGATAYFFDAEDRLTGHWQITDRLGVYQQLMAGRTPPPADGTV